MRLTRPQTPSWCRSTQCPEGRNPSQPLLPSGSRGGSRGGSNHENPPPKHPSPDRRSARTSSSPSKSKSEAEVPIRRLPPSSRIYPASGREDLTGRWYPQEIAEVCVDFRVPGIVGPGGASVPGASFVIGNEHSSCGGQPEGRRSGVQCPEWPGFPPPIGEVAARPPRKSSGAAVEPLLADRCPGNAPIGAVEQNTSADIAAPAADHGAPAEPAFAS